MNRFFNTIHTLCIMLAVVAATTFASQLSEGVEGLTVKTVTVGSGPAVENGALVKVHYKGMLASNDKVIDQTNKQAFEFVLGIGSVIKGWDLGIVGMKKGEKRILVIAPELGYGSKNLGVIPPNSTLKYEIELVSFEKGLESDVFPELSALKWEKKVPGVRYSTIKEGNGTEIGPGAKVVLHYTGWLKGGTKFESSKDLLRPLALTIGEGRAIKAWDLGLVGMKEGGSYYIYAEAHMAYGATTYSMIPPNSDLIFKVDIEKVVGTKLPFADIIWESSPDGYMFSTLKKGNGSRTVKAGDKVQVHYTGWLENGTMFDSSVKRGTPFSFQVGMGRVIRGWDLGVAGMKVGEKKSLKIPGNLAYGERGAGGMIPPDATLIFEVEVLDIE